MKKKFILAVLLCSTLLLISGCGKQEELVEKEQKTMTCTLSRNDVVNGYKLDSTYKVFYTDKVVDKVETEEVISSDSSEILSQFETQLNSLYQTMDETYGGYDINISNDGAQVVSLVKIDYSKLDLSQLAKDEPTMKNYLDSNNKLTLDGIKTMYTSQGITCE